MAQEAPPTRRPLRPARFLVLEAGRARVRAQPLDETSPLDPQVHGCIRLRPALADLRLVPCQMAHAPLRAAIRCPAVRTRSGSWVRRHRPSVKSGRSWGRPKERANGRNWCRRSWSKSTPPTEILVRAQSLSARAARAPRSAAGRRAAGHHQARSEAYIHL